MEQEPNGSAAIGEGPGFERWRAARKGAVAQQCLYRYAFETVDAAMAVSAAFVEQHNEHWLVGRLGYRTPATDRRSWATEAAYVSERLVQKTGSAIRVRFGGGCGFPTAITPSAAARYARGRPMAVPATATSAIRIAPTVHTVLEWKTRPAATYSSAAIGIATE